MTVLKTSEEIVNEIAEVLHEGDGDFIENIANQVLVPKVRYIEDSLFEHDIEVDEDEVDSDGCLTNNNGDAETDMEQLRRDEKNGLYPGREDIAN